MQLIHFLTVATSLSTIAALPLNQYINDTERVIGGQAISIEQLPFIVALEAEQVGQFCGGAILDATTVITAAHCTPRNQDVTIYVRAGSSQSESGGQHIRVAQVKRHPSYGSPERFDNDICILKLASPLQMGIGVAPVQLVSAGSSPPAGSPVLGAGWGYTNGHGSPSKQLLKADLQIVDLNICRGALHGITENMLCAGSPNGQGVCRGDSGGPLIMNNNVLVGTVSFGVVPCDTRVPAVFAKVERYLDWIAQNK